MDKDENIRDQCSGYQHPKCFLRSRKNCSKNISKEHYVSHTVLNKVANSNDRIEIAGLAWMPKNKLVKDMKKSKLVANILCTHHNNALSGLDAIAGDFISSFTEINHGLSLPKPIGKSFSVKGRTLEQWILKTGIGMIESGNTKRKNGKNYNYNPVLIDLLCDSTITWPDGWGLYVSTPKPLIYHSKSFEFAPKYNKKNGNVLAFYLRFNGFEMHLCVGKPKNPADYDVLRPACLRFSKKNTISHINFDWDKIPVGKRVDFEQVGTYQGDAPSHRLDKISVDEIKQAKMSK